MDLASLTRVTASERRGPGSDAERRAARALAAELEAVGRSVTVEPLWVRPSWPLVHALHAALLVAGGLVAIGTPVAGLAVTAAALVSLVLDLLGRVFLLRRLTPSRATQNLVAVPSGPERPVVLVIAAGYDAPRGGIALRPGFQRWWQSLERRAGGRVPGPLAWPAVAGGVLLAVAAARTAGADGSLLDLVQLLATIPLLVAVVLLLDIALSDAGPGAGEAAAAAVATDLARELGETPLRALEVELVLAGAANGPALGMRSYLRARRHWARHETIVLALGPCSRGGVRWASAEGPLAALRYHPQLNGLCAEVAEAERRLGAEPFVARGLPSCAYPARTAGFSAVLVRARPEEPVAPEDDTPEAADPAAARGVLEFCLALAARIDRDVAERYGAG